MCEKNRINTYLNLGINHSIFITILSCDLLDRYFTSVLSQTTDHGFFFITKQSLVTFYLPLQPPHAYAHGTWFSRRQRQEQPPQLAE